VVDRLAPYDRYLAGLPATARDCLIRLESERAEKLAAQRAKCAARLADLEAAQRGRVPRRTKFTEPILYTPQRGKAYYQFPSISSKEKYLQEAIYLLTRSDAVLRDLTHAPFRLPRIDPRRCEAGEIGIVGGPAGPDSPHFDVVELLPNDRIRVVYRAPAILRSTAHGAPGYAMGSRAAYSAIVRAREAQKASKTATPRPMATYGPMILADVPITKYKLGTQLRLHGLFQINETTDYRGQASVLLQWLAGPPPDLPP
jgi:hypothetical protein